MTYIRKFNMSQATNEYDSQCSKEETGRKWKVDDDEREHVIQGLRSWRYVEVAKMKAGDSLW